MKVLYSGENEYSYLAHFAIVKENKRVDILDIFHECIKNPQEAHSRIKEVFKIDHKGKLPSDITSRIIKYDPYIIENIPENIPKDHYIVSRIQREQPEPDYPELKIKLPSEFPLNSIEFKIMDNIFGRITGEDFKRYFGRYLVENDGIEWEGIEPTSYKHDPLLRELQGVVSGIVSKL
jgi:hypothetical protein